MHPRSVENTHPFEGIPVSEGYSEVVPELLVELNESNEDVDREGGILLQLISSLLSNGLVPNQSP